MERYLAVMSMPHSPTVSSVGGNLLDGIFAEARARDCPFLIDVNVPMNPDLMTSASCAGVIGFFIEEPMREKLRDCPFPVVNVSNTLGVCPGAANILSDDAAVGRMAADFLLGQGHADFLVIEQEARVFSRERAEGFRSRLRGAGRDCAVLRLQTQYRASLWSPEIYIEQTWEQAAPVLAKLPPRAAVFAVSDWVAWPFALGLERHDPDRAALTSMLGVDNLADSFFDPRRAGSLSSIVPGFRECGRQALAWMLERTERKPKRGGKQTPETKTLRCPPERIVERASTAMVACGDPVVARAGRAMWLLVRKERPVELSVLAKEHGMSPRSMELHFQKHLGRSARELLWQFRIEYGQHLLRTNADPVADIAARCGYADAPGFSNSFKRLTGLSPREWREY